MKQLWFVILCVPLWLNSQNREATQQSSGASTLGIKKQGIQWTEGLSFNEVREKAKKENRYIFLDCYATWCGPCIDMEKKVFINDSIGDFFNKHFINIKVQMDRTKKDEEQITCWYDDAAAIGKQYKIDGLPCFIFLSPQGILLLQDIGYKKAFEFLSIAKTVICSDRVYEGPYAEYDRLVANYKKGILQYDRMAYMIKIARKFDTALARPLSKLYSDYLNKLSSSQRYTKDNIEFWSGYVLKSGSPAFQYFYKDGKLIDRVMQKRGYAAAVVDKTIYYEMILPFFTEQNTNRAIPMTGMYLRLPNVKADSSEADWKKLEKLIRSKFNNATVNRNMLAAKIEWYNRHWNYQAICKYRLIQLRKYPKDVEEHCNIINSGAWNAFMYVTDKRMLREYIKWMKELAVRFPQRGDFLDTYANLLYKIGKKEEAIIWQGKAILADNRYAEHFRKALEQMKRGEPTYGVRIL